MNKKIIVFFILGMLAGILACGAGIYMGRSDANVAAYETGMGEGNIEGKIISSKLVDTAQKDATAGQEEPALDEPGRDGGKPEVTALSSRGTAYEEWDDETVYNGGDLVVCQGKIYKAKWWTQGEVPGKADVWEDTLETVDKTDQKDKSDNTDRALPDKKTGTQTTGSKKGSFKVVGYYPSWKPAMTDKIRYDVLTHIVYAFAIPTADGKLKPLENVATAKSIINKAHKNGVKVLLAVGGWSYNDVPLEQTFISATATEKKYKKLANAIISMCEKYGFDGVDMDWEHPRVDGNSGKQYEKFMVYLGKKLHKKDKLLTSAVLSGATADGNIYYDAAAHSDKVLKAVDWIHVMAYDGGDGERHSTYKFAVQSAKYWKNTRKLPAEKVVLGMPFYARPSWASYEDILKADKNAWKKDVTSYNGMEVWYNGMSTIKKKTKYAYKNLGGVMIWELTQDTGIKSKSLMTAVGKAVKETE